MNARSRRVTFIARRFTDRTDGEFLDPNGVGSCSVPCGWNGWMQPAEPCLLKSAETTRAFRANSNSAPRIVADISDELSQSGAAVRRPIVSVIL